MIPQKVLIIQNYPTEGPGILGKILAARQIDSETVDLSQNPILPKKDFSALVVLGGPDSANDPTPKMISELSFVKDVIFSGIPFLGICLGLQVGVKALGGEVLKNPIKELATKDPDGNYFTVELTPEGKNDPLFRGLNKSLKVFHLHGETVKPKGGMAVLATGKWCQNQIIKLGSKAYGFQGHFELTEEMLNLWLDNDPDLKQLSQIAGRDRILSDFIIIKDEYTQNATTIFNNFVDLI